jgi:hypothetical protein
MKTKHGLFFGFAGLLVAAIFSLTGCLMEDDGGGGSYGPTDDTYDYPLKFLYEHHFSYTRNSNAIFPGNPYPTLAEVIKFLAGEDSLWETEVDIYAYVNSKWGEQTAKLWQPYIQYWEKPMDTGLITYWNNRGLTKIKLDGGTAQNISTDSYIYYPKGADQDTSDKKYPLVLLFHGGGEPAYQVETFGFCQIAAGEGLFLAAGETNSAANMHNLMNYMLDTYPMIDQERVYAVGSSQGGGAANNFSLTYIQEVAAVGVMERLPGRIH